MTSPPAAGSRPTALLLRIGGDILIYAAGFVLSALATANIPGAVSYVDDRATLQGPGPGVFLLGALAWSTVFLRRRLPIVPLIAGGVLALLGTEYVLLLVGAHAALVRWSASRRRQLMTVVALVVTAFVLRELLTSWGDNGLIEAGLRRVDAADFPLSATVWVITILIAVLSILTSFGTAALTRARRETRRHQRRADIEHSRADALSTQLERQTERERLARDIHDALAHRLSVISLQSGALEEAARSQDEVVAHAAQALRKQAHASLEDLRGLLGELRREGRADATGDPEPPSIASMRTIGHLIRSVRESGTPVDAFVLIEDAEQAGAALDRTAYRVVQESLTNALKHAPGAPISVFVEAAVATGVRIRVSNPLVAHSAHRTPGSGSGTTGIAERAELLGGTAWIGETEGTFLVDVALPWPDER